MFSLRTKLVATAVGLALMAAPAAHATTVLNDTFDAEHGGTSDLNYNSFANWTSTAVGGVDLVATPDYGIHCAGGSGSCVDLDGTPGPGQLTSINSYAFTTGQAVTLSFDVSGNQRDASQSDQFQMRMLFSPSSQLNNFIFDLGAGPTNAGNFNTTEVTYTTFLLGDFPWTHISFGFVAGSAGSMRMTFGSTSDDNVGPLLDNVRLDVSGGAPEPSTWALMIGGFGLAGAALRRRKAVAA